MELSSVRTRKRRSYTDEDLLVWWQMQQQGLSISEIARQRNVDRTTIRRRLMEYEPPEDIVASSGSQDAYTAVRTRKRRSYTDEDIASWWQMLQDGLNINDIAREVGANWSTISRRLNEYLSPTSARERVELVDRWAELLQTGCNLIEIAHKFCTRVQFVQADLTRRGLICECGIIIGREGGDVTPGHDGVCGYCIEERHEFGKNMGLAHELWHLGWKSSSDEEVFR